MSDALGSLAGRVAVVTGAAQGIGEAIARRMAGAGATVLLGDIQDERVAHVARSIPVVVLTSSRAEPDIAEAYRLGVNSYIVKPVDFEKFTDVMQTAGAYWLLVNQPATLT